jgi:voltage-dependent calcium channel L type alpha-1D
VPNGCGSILSYFYFTSFILIVAYVFLNLFIAVILQGFTEAEAIENGKLNGIHYEAFRLEWSKYDKKGTGLLDVRKLPDLLSHLDAPVGSKGMTDSEQT